MIKPRILIVDDRSDIRSSARFVLEDNGYDVIDANSPCQAKVRLNETKLGLILLDMNYSQDITSGEEDLAFLTWLYESEYNVPTIAMTADNSRAAAAENRSGADGGQKLTYNSFQQNNTAQVKIDS